MPRRRVHRHPDSEGRFASLAGASCISVAAPDQPAGISVFRLDESVCVRRHVWHELVATEPARVFISENAVATGEDRPLDPPTASTTRARDEP